MQRIACIIFFALLSCARPALAEYVSYKGAVWVVPCGGRCYQSWKFLSIDRYDDGIMRALIEVVNSYNGVSVGKRFWQFAACRRGLMATGYTSDGSDLQWESVTHEDGSPKDGSVVSNLYSRWEAICRY